MPVVFVSNNVLLLSMTTLLNSGNSLLEKMEIFNCLTTFQFTQLTSLKQWSWLHANQPFVPQATPAPGFERLLLLPQITEQGLESEHKQSFLEDLDEVDALFNGSTDHESMFDFNPEKDFDQVSDEFLNEVLSEPSPSPVPRISPLLTTDKAIIPTIYDLFQSQPSSPDNSPIDNYVNNLRQPNLSIVGIPAGNLNDENPHHPVPSETNNPSNNNLPNSPEQVNSNFILHSLPNSPPCSPSQRHSLPPQSPSISDAGSTHSHADEGIGSQSDTSDQESVDDYLDLSIHSAVLSSPVPKADHDNRLTVKQEPELLSTKSGRRKRGPRPQVKYRGDGPMQLWQFLLELLIAPEYTNLVRWTQDEDYEFKILKPSTVAKMWGEKKNKPTMNYEKLSRGLRYYYGKSVIEKVHGKRYVYQFKCDIPKILGYDPMAPVKSEEDAEDLVCGEPILSPEQQVEDLLVNSYTEDGLLALP